MIIDKKTKIIFENRKQCRAIVGNSRYYRMVKEGRLYFVDDSKDIQQQIDYIKNNF